MFTRSMYQTSTSQMPKVKASEADVPADVMGPIRATHGRNAVGSINDSRVQGLRGCLIESQERVCRMEKELGPEWECSQNKGGSYEFKLGSYQTLSFDFKSGDTVLRSTIPTKGIPGVIYIQAPHKTNEITQDVDGKITARNVNS